MLGDRRAFDARSARPAPPGRNLPSVQTTSPQPSFHSLSSKKLPKSPRTSKTAPTPAQDLLCSFGDEFAAFNCHLEGRKLHLEVTAATRPAQGVVERLVEASAEVPCDRVIVSVVKSADFAEWMRRLLYAGFTVVSKRDTWAPLPPGTVACVLDMSDRSSSQSATSDDSSVLTDDDSDASDSDDDDWLDDDD